ncbi:MAG: hypothetical protein ABI432_10015 [Flavobacteriales bacterium]
MTALSRTMLLFALFGALHLSGQSKMMLFGIVEDQRSDAMQNVCVRVFTDSIAGDSIFTDAKGSYQLFVPIAGCQRLVYTADAHHRKVVEVDANGKMDPADRNQEWNLRVDITLLAAEQDLPADLLDTPVGMAAWAPATKSFEWDQAYTARYMLRYKEALKQAKRK